MLLYEVGGDCPLLSPNDSTVLIAAYYVVCVWRELLSLVWGDWGVHGRICGLYADSMVLT